MKRTFEHEGSWPAKFRHAFRGIGRAIIGNRSESTTRSGPSANSFYVHLPAAVLVLIAAWWLQLSSTKVLLLVLCIGGVLIAELFNTALECLAKAMTDQVDDHIRDALDIASGAVLTASVVATIVGAVVFLF